MPELIITPAAVWAAACSVEEQGLALETTRRWLGSVVACLTAALPQSRTSVEAERVVSALAATATLLSSEVGATASALRTAARSYLRVEQEVGLSPLAVPSAIPGAATDRPEAGQS